MELLSDYDGTVILVSHSRDEIYRFSEELLIIDDGKQICYGDTKEIFDHPKKVEAARLTGCKNIVPAERLDAHHVRIPDWGTCLHLKQMIDVDITHIGLRAHEFIPVWGEREDNCIPVNVKERQNFHSNGIFLKRRDGRKRRYLLVCTENPLGRTGRKRNSGLFETAGKRDSFAEIESML